MAEKPLSNVRVLDLTHYVAGPYCTKLMADLGAEVVKVERPGQGDGARRLGPFPNDEPDPEKSGLFLYLNTNKKGITLNLKTETGAKIFKELVKGSDALVENFSPRVMPSLGLDYEILEKINPRLVMTSISNFGQTGPYRDYKATDIVAYALGGLMHLTGEPDREPLRLPGRVVQFTTGLTAFTATVIALYCCEETRIGQHADVSMMETIAGSHNTTYALYTYSQELMQRGSREFFGPVLPAKDGYLGVVVQQRRWPELFKLMDKPELVDDPRFHDAAARREHAEEYNAILASWVAEHSKTELYHAAQARGMAFGSFNNFEEVMDSPQFKARDFFVDIDHPGAGSLPYPGMPFKVGDLDWSIERAPLMGEHNEEIYCGRLGYSKEDLVKLRQRDII